MKHVLVGCLIVIISPLTTAEFLRITPPGWSENRQGGVIVLAAPTGNETITLSEHVGADAGVIAAELFDANLPVSAKILSRKQNKRDKAAIDGGAYKSGAGPIGLIAVAAPRPSGGHLALLHEFNAKDKSAARRMLDAAMELIAMANRDERLTLAATSAPAPAGQPEVPATGANNQTVKAFVFDLTYSYGVGGGVFPDYDPMVLFADGTACVCLERAVEDIDVDKLRRERPKKVGRWRKSGRDYIIDWGGGRKQKRIKGSVAPPRVVPTGRSLQGTYQSIGGGGNTAMGGGVLTAAVKDLTFHPDGSFEQSNKTFVSSDAGVGGSKRGKSGSWSLRGSTLTLAYLDGKTVRTSLFFAAKPSTPDPLRVLWIGGTNYKRRD